MIVAEITVAIDALGTLQTFLFASEGWTTGAADTPANTWVQPRLMQPANYRRELFSGNRTFGEVRAAFGECRLSNMDGGLDDMVRYGFDGHSFVLRSGRAGDAYPGAFETLLVCTMQTPWFELTETSGAVHIKLTDRISDLSKPLTSGIYAGTGGAEGQASANGLRKPVVYGSLFNVKPQIIDDSLLIYSIGAPPAGMACVTNGVSDGHGASLNYGDATGVYPPPPFGPGIDCPTYAALATATVNPGRYALCASLGLIRLGTLPTFDITCAVRVVDAATWLDASHSRPGAVLLDMAAAVGVTSVVTADFTALDAARSAGYGLRVDNEDSASTAMAKIANSAGAWFGFDRLGQLRAAALAAPSGTPVYTFTQHNITKIQRLDNQADAGAPIWSVIARSDHNDCPQTAFAGSVPAWARSWYDKEWPKQTAAQNASIKLKYPNSQELTIDVYTGTAGSPTMGDLGEAARRLALYGVEREMVQVTTPITLELLRKVDLCAVAMLKYPRYSWGAGKLMLVVAVGLNFDSNRADVILWG